jgi:hypothetical protein
MELYSVPLSGGSPLKFNNPLVSGGDVFNDYSISRDSRRVVYRADQDTNGVTELYVSFELPESIYLPLVLKD